MLLKIKREIDFKNTVYILKKEEIYQIFEEDSEGDESVSLDEFFKGYKRWERGIYTERWYSVFINALSLREPVLEVPKEVNFLLTFEPVDGGFVVSGIVFDRSGEDAFEKALLFVQKNRPYISFEVSSYPSAEPLRVGRDKLFLLLENLVKELREIRRLTLKTYEETKEVKRQTERNLHLTRESFEVLKEIKELLEQKFSLLIQKVEGIEKKITSDRGRVDSAVTAVILNSPGVYTASGDPVSLPPLGKIGDYVEVDYSSFVSFFGLKAYLTDKEIEALKEVINKEVLKKIERGDTHFTSEELNEILENLKLPAIPYKKKWVLTVKVKRDDFQKLVKAIKNTLGGVPLKDIEAALRCLFKEHPIKGNPPLNFELLVRCFSEKYRPKLERLRDLISSLERGKSQLSDLNFVVGPSEPFLLALELEARRRGKKLLIKQV